MIYRSKQFGEIELRLSRPDSEEDRRLFAQYLWNAGVLLAEFVGGSLSGCGSGSTLSDESEDGEGEKISPSGMRRRRRDDDWKVTGEKVLELGAGESPPAGRRGEGGNGVASWMMAESLHMRSF